MRPFTPVLLAASFCLVGACSSAPSNDGETYEPGDDTSDGGSSHTDAGKKKDGGTKSDSGSGGDDDDSGNPPPGDDDDGGNPPPGDDDDGGNPPPPPPPGGYTFGSHPLHYPSDVHLPSGSQSSLDNATADAYDTWKSKYVKQGCNGYYVHSGGGSGTNVGDEVSEGHGYGMVITAIMAGHDPDARTIFDGMYAFFHKFPTSSHQNLMAWTVDVAGGCKTSSDQMDSATDGDLDVAFALLLADKQWPNAGYLAKAKAVIADIADGDMHQTTKEPVLGDWATSSDPQYNATRPSDFMLDHFRAFKTATGDAAWTTSVDNVYGLVAQMQTSYAPSTGLLPDFIVNTTTTPKPAAANFLEGSADGQYGYNSCRVPWRMGTDYIVSHDARAKTALQKINAWIMSATGNDASKIRDGYKLDGTKGSGQTGTSGAFSSPFAVSAMVGSDQAWLDALWSGCAIDEDYYADSITLLSMIVLSGNWWAP